MHKTDYYTVRCDYTSFTLPLCSEETKSYSSDASSRETAMSANPSHLLLFRSSHDLTVLSPYWAACSQTHRSAWQYCRFITQTLLPVLKEFHELDFSGDSRNDCGLFIKVWHISLMWFDLDVIFKLCLKILCAMGFLIALDANVTGSCLTPCLTSEC